MFSDVHCHLYFFENYRELIQSALKKNVKLMFSNSTSLETLEQNKKIVLEFLSNVKALYALHPCDLLKMKKQEREKGMNWIRENLQGKECVGIGETGLDYKYAESEEEKKLQCKYFEEHISIAVEENLPIVVHSRRAQEKCLKMLEEKNAKLVLMHWFYGKQETLKRVIENNYFISVGPTILYRGHAQEFVKEIPFELMLLETDASLTKFSGKRSEPAWIPEIAEKVAELKEIPLKELEKQLEKNTTKLFGV